MSVCPLSDSAGTGQRPRFVEAGTPQAWSAWRRQRL